jgi:tRNA A-37 threonylcarbamoyl transferase component Bud32
MIGTILSGRYRLESKLGSGGMSTVYLARDETLERLIAVKIMHREISDDEAQLERFRREARAVAQVSHPNVVAVIDAGEDGGHPYIVFEYVDGETLKQRIERLSRLPLDESAAYAIEIGRGLAAAHARNLVHRDVKPQNVLIDAEGRAKVTDFGIARELDSKGLTATGRVLGTTDYVSPEQAMGQAVDARSDIYSLGVVLYEMLTGQPPFTAETLVGVAMKHVNEDMPDVQARRIETSAALASVVEHSTHKDTRKRYPNMAAMLSDLEQALEVEIARTGGSGTGEATAVLRSVPQRRRQLLTRRRISIAGILLVLLAAGAAVAIVALTGDAGPSHQPGPGGTSQVHLQGANDFDPLGDNLEENPSLVGLAVDGNPTTYWRTETYTSGPVLQDAAGKDGVGIYVDAGSPVKATQMIVQSRTPGWSGEVYAASSGPPDNLAGWGDLIGSVDGASTKETVPLHPSAPARYYLLWITSLSQVSDGYRVEIGEITLSG